MATRRQCQRKLAQARFHQQQSRERNRAARAGVAAATAELEKVVDLPKRRSTVITAPNLGEGYEKLTRDELRAMAATLKIRGRSVMTKDALIKAISAHS